jgi:hypothetical protein
MSNMARNCRWILSVAVPGKAGVYCEKPVKWTMQPDDGPGSPLVRVYESFCPEHKAIKEGRS